MCLYPRLIQNKKFTITKKNGGNIPAVNDSRTLRVPIDCGNCIECRKQKSREWQVRLQEDIKTNTGAKFITLTFTNESIKNLSERVNTITEKTVRRTIIMKNGKKRNYYNYTYKERNPKIKGYELDNAIATEAMRLFNERYRKLHNKALRHWLVTELGHNGTENIHLHGIIWPNCTMDEIEKIWEYGWIWKFKYIKGIKTNYVNNRTINYCTKYVSKRDELHMNYKPLTLTSPGIGNNYTKTINAERNKFNINGTRQYYRTETGHKISLPKYWRNKLYNDDEKEELWLQSMDKKIAWVCGEKIDISNGEDELFRLRDHYRKKNRRLGYGSYHVDEDRLQWEEDRRASMFLQRIQNAEKKQENKRLPREV